MNTYQLMDVAFSALERRKDSPSSSDGQHGRKAALSGAQNELSGEGRPTVDAGTAGVDLRITQYRQAIYAHERLIEKLYDLARADRYDELHDLVRAEYLAIHGPQG